MVIRTPFGDNDPFLIDNLVKEGSVLGPFLNNCSLDKLVCNQGAFYQNGVAGIKQLEFVDDIADPNKWSLPGKRSNDYIVAIMQQKNFFCC